MPEGLDEGGYFDLTTLDAGSDVRRETVLALEQLGIHVEYTHHEVGPSQHEIDMRYSSALKMADDCMTYRITVKEYAMKYGWHATFMPKPLFGDNGSGMHVHQSLAKGGTNLFTGDGYGGLSQMALWYIGGIFKHARAINAFANSTTNSYKRLVPGFEAPVLLAYSARNRSASCRIPFGQSPKAKRVEVRFPDPTANPYLAFSAMLLLALWAGFWGHSSRRAIFRRAAARAATDRAPSTRRSSTNAARPAAAELRVRAVREPAGDGPGAAHRSLAGRR